ncbi:MAG: DALR anticodon-binding domain-containing protein, partial [Sphingobacterium sp.]
SVLTSISPYERDLIQQLGAFPETIEASAQEFSPAQLANYIYEVAKLYNKFYHEESILKAEANDVKNFRLHLSAAAAKVIAKGMGLLGICVPERM